MLVKITDAQGHLVTNGVLIENRTYCRAIDLLGYFEVDHIFTAGETSHELLLEKLNSYPILGEGVNDIQLTKNFNLREFQCKGASCGCNNAVKVDPELLRRLQAMRDETGLPIRVRSGYRCPAHNRAIGSQDTSQHPRGTASDIEVVGMPLEEQYDLAEKHFPDGGVGTGASWGVHVDVRGSRARWSY